ncbi:MAG: S8 family serine peptidase [Candidatus Thalassarchaeaceae archaeon]|nr:S8 family serine peptidase [Candidatus Thalassarchaeaceae archaeon]
MSNRSYAILMLLLMLLLPLASVVPSQQTEEVNDWGEIPTIEYTKIEVDPNSVRGLENSILSEGDEQIRLMEAETRLGMYDEHGLRLSYQLPPDLAVARFDIVMVIVDGEVGLWSAQEEISSLRGAIIRAHIPPSGFFVQGDPTSLHALKSLPSVVAVHPVPLAMFVADEILATSAQSEILLRIEGWRSSHDGLPVDDVVIDDWKWSVSDIVESTMDVGDILDAGRFEGVVATSDIAFIAANPAVSWLRLPPGFELHNDNSRGHMQISSVVSAFATPLNGSGQIVAVADSGLDQDHGDMNNRINGVVSVVSGDSSTEDTHSGHGTHVACTVLGDGSKGGFAGVAPESNLYFQAMERDSDGQFYSPSMNYILNAAYDNGARIHSNSWGAHTNFGQYTTDSVDVDDRVNYYDQYWSYDGLAVLFSAGNDGDGTGTITPPATAKNQIAVGNHHNRGGSAPDTLATSSSRGPTDDGRLKPDISAPGSWVRSCRSQDASDISTATWSSQWYLEYSGTSMAAPNAAGASALIREYLMEIAQRPEPQGALVKSLLILGAEDMDSRDIPNNDEGWGRINLARSLNTIGDTGVWVDDRNYLRSGNTRDYSFNLTHGWQQLKVVLSWSDYRGSTWASTQLQNDLDLVVTAPDGTTTYLGNVFQNGRSTSGGSADDTNNVEVVLIDQAQKGVWTVSVSDVRHGGQKSEQTYALAIRGAGVDDLSPDAAFVPQSFLLSDPIPQVNEEVTFSIQITNMGSRVMDDLQVRATAGGQSLTTHTIALGPGEVRGVNWQWTPTVNGDNDIIMRVDPTDAFEELDESNNIYLETIGVTEPGVRVTAESVIKQVGDSTTSTAQWNLTIRNTALISTNATILVEKPIRTSDGQSFDWFQSFSQTTFSLNGSGNEAVGLTMVHPAPPEPGIYQFTVTGRDVDNGIDYPITLTLDVPVLSGFRFANFNQQVVSPVEDTSFDVTMYNEGNGPQGWDLDLLAPSGWHLGFDSLGSMAGTPSASSGYIPMSGTKTVGVTLVPPTGQMVSAGTALTGSLVATSQLDNNLIWQLDLNFVVSGYQNATLDNESTFGTLRPDSQLNLRFTVKNEGNIALSLTASAELPGGWDISNQLPTMTLQPTETKSIVVALQGNGLAASGPIELLMIDSSGYRVTWTGYLDVQSVPQPSISFDEIVFSDGTRSSSVLGLGNHPVGMPGFRLIWLITNSGSQSWTPTTNLLMPSSAWTGLCDPVGEIAPGSGERIECLVVMPATTEAGSEPAVTMQIIVDDVQIADTVTLKTAATKQVLWSSLVEPESFVDGIKATYSVDIANDGNSILSHRITAVGPDGWVVEITNAEMVELQPGEARTLNVDVTPDDTAPSTIILSLESADDVSGSSYSFDLNASVNPAKEVASGNSAWVWGIAIILILALIVGVVVVIASTKKEASPLVGIPQSLTIVPPVTPVVPIAESVTPPPQNNQVLPQPPPQASAPATPATGAYPLPPPPQAQPAQAPDAKEFQVPEPEPDTSISTEAVHEELDENPAVVESITPPVESEETSVPTEPEKDDADEQDPNHKCWVCLVGLPPKGWQACPQCGSRYHLSDSQCGVSALKLCRTCNNPAENFVKVE